MRKLINSRWLLAFCGILDAIISIVYWVGPWQGRMVLLGKLTLAAGGCTIAAGIWNTRKGYSWLLILNGLACTTLGALFAFWTGPLAFRAIALLMAVMAMSIGAYELATARALRRLTDEWLLGAAGIACLGFAFAFLAFVIGWMKLEPAAPAQSLHWLGAYFGFSAICLLLLIARLRGPSFFQSNGWRVS
jgi:uncharacterized membrane protein HdeD (DUF308 family)